MAERVADQDEVDAGLVDKARGGVVVGGERGDGLALALHFAERGHGDFWEGKRRAARGARPTENSVRLMFSPVPLRRLRMRPEQVEYTPWPARNRNRNLRQSWTDSPALSMAPTML